MTNHPPNKPKIVIVAHTSRAAWAQQLATKAGAAKVCTDDGTLGCYRNHETAWQWHQKHSYHGWAVVIEDDAIPTADFPNQLHAALADAPPIISIASLYLGKHRPPQHQIQVAAAVNDATSNNHAWIITSKLISAVGVAIRTELLASVCAHLQRLRHLDIDEAITEWAGQRHMIGYTMPSLLDHRDSESIASHRDGAARLPGRKAWRHGGRDNWKTTVTIMPL